MTHQDVDLFLAAHGQDFPHGTLSTVRERLLAIDNPQTVYQATSNVKSPYVALILSFLFGTLGVDRFYLGQVLLGLLKLITCGGAGIWYVVDWFVIMGAARKRNLKRVLSAPLNIPQ